VATWKVQWFHHKPLFQENAMHYCGLDLGARKTQVCIINEDEQVLMQRSINSDPASLLAALKESHVGDDIHIVAESTFNWDWVVDSLQDNDFDIQLAHTLGLHAISRAKVKTDKRDAKTLAKLLKGNLIPPAYITPKQRRGLRDLLRKRWYAVANRAKEYRALRHLLYRQGRWDHSLGDIKKYVADDAHQISDDPHLQFLAKQSLQRINMFSEQIDALEKYLIQHAKADFGSDLKHLMTIPGVGITLALTIILETGEIGRFADARKYSSYCRVVPGCANSSGVEKRGRNSKQGNAFLKWAFMHAATKAVQFNADFKKLHQRHLKRHQGKGGKVIAYNTVAHRIAQVAFYILRDGTSYEKEKLFPQANTSS
jgi:transposase